MKILVLTDLYPPDVIGGYELGCRQATDALRARGHDVRVLTSAPRVPAGHEPHIKRTLHLVESWSDYLFRKSAPVTAHLEQSESLRVSAFNVHALLEELREFEPDVVYVWMLVGVGGLGLMACLHHQRVPWVWHLMDDVPTMLCKSSGRIVPAFAREFGAQLRGHYITCSSGLTDEIAEAGVKLNGPIEVIPNWVVGPRRSTRPGYRAGDRLKLISAAGQIDRQIDKGMDLIIRTAALLRDAGHEAFDVDLYGKVTDGYAAHLIHRHGLEDRVHLRGTRTQDELSDLFAESDVFLFPTRPREPFGFAPLEAAARGCVPLMSEVCGIAEWFVHGVHVLKSARRAEDFARTIAAILHGEIDLGPMAARLARIVNEEFHLDAIAPKIERVLQAAASGDRDGAGAPEEAYRLALLAERLSRVMIGEWQCA